MQEQPVLTFWDHLDELRRVLFRVVGVVVVLMLVAFCFKEEMFGIVLAPQQDNFPLYRWLGAESFSVQLSLRLTFKMAKDIVQGRAGRLLGEFRAALSKEGTKYQNRMITSAF